MNGFPWRWLAVAVFILSSTLNYLDRSLLTVLAPLILKEFHLNQTSYGEILSAFSFVYMFSSLGAGILLDRIGLNKSIWAAVAWWSSVSILTAFTTGFGSLLGIRAALGLGESAGVPAFGKLNGTYLKPSERAMGTASNQIGLSLGGIVVAAAVPFAVVHGWRLPFAFCGALGLLWIPLWLFTSKQIPPQFGPAVAGSVKNPMAIWATRDLWLLMAANVLWMPLYSYWTQWTSLYLIHVQHISVKESAGYVWIPPLFSIAGGFFGGGLSMWWINQKTDPVSARRRAIWISAIGAMSTLALPYAPSPQAATAIICLSFFFLLAGSVNIYALPIDVFGAQNAGMAIAALTFAFGLMQTVISPLVGRMHDTGMYSQVVWLLTVPLLLSAALLMGCSRRREGQESGLVGSSV
jgi:ACS family hexuronate transporter-like MFS transporter